MNERLIFANNRDGWSLELRQYFDPERLVPERRPVVMIPGYCMNTFILNFHPRGHSMVSYLVDNGFEVWTANLRGQGGSRRQIGSRRYGFREIALTDLPTVFDTVQRRNKSGHDQLDAVGCSLGASFLFAYLAHNLDAHPMGSLVSIGGPLRWNKAHPLLKVLFTSPRLAGVVPVVGTRAAARRALPVARRVPGLLNLYMNTSMIDLDQADQLVQTVDDPIPYLNQQIARWVQSKDLYVGGVNVTRAMKHVETPLLCIAANADGIVPPTTAVSALDAFGSQDITTLHVGDEQNWFAHADLFINDEAEQRVFEPLSAWLTERNG